ncbi:MAG TPA: sarcosine oxidase subunit gamma family protein [Acetobacteraceae bacterium]|nr:sarcosine oxidase subunit gamma family protein [Acetobacteraceae bacterium]
MSERAHPLATLAVGSPQSDAVRMTALPPVARLLIRGDAIGIPQPALCRAIRVRDNWVLWLGPDEFLLIAPDEAMPMLEIAAPTVDVSHRETALRVSGPCAAWALNAFCALDLHPSAFPVGMCTRTVLGKAEIVLWRIDADEFRIEVARSFAPYVWACLEEVRREFLD